MKTLSIFLDMTKKRIHLNNAITGIYLGDNLSGASIPSDRIILLTLKYDGQIENFIVDNLNKHLFGFAKLKTTPSIAGENTSVLSIYTCEKINYNVGISNSIKYK
jgi:hypothetical protein